MGSDLLDHAGDVVPDDRRKRHLIRVVSATDLVVQRVDGGRVDTHPNLTGFDLRHGDIAQLESIDPTETGKHNSLHQISHIGVIVILGARRAGTGGFLSCAHDPPTPVGQCQYLRGQGHECRAVPGDATRTTRLSPKPPSLLYAPATTANVLFPAIVLAYEQAADQWRMTPTAPPAFFVELQARHLNAKLAAWSCTPANAAITLDT